MTDSAQAGIQAADRIPSDDTLPLAFTATVTGIREVARVHGKQVWQIALSRTQFTPERCKGSLTATARSGRKLSIEIASVECDGSGVVWHTASKPLQEGTDVEGAVQCTVMIEERHASCYTQDVDVPRKYL